MSTFSGLNTGLSSLYAQRRGMELAGHNVANANTEGYSRQRVNLEANAGPVSPAFHSRWNGVGNGVDVAGLDRMRDVFLEARGVQERGTDSQLRGRQVAFTRVEGLFGEPGSSGLQAQLSDFWAGWDDVANHPTDVAARSQLLERSQTLATGLNMAAQGLSSQFNDSHQRLSATVQSINAAASSVAEYNTAITSAVRAGLTANDLMDQRDLLVQKLASEAGVSVRQGEAGSVDVYLGGTALVRGGAAERLAVTGTTELTNPAGQVGVAWERDAYPAPVGGAASGLLQELNDVIPSYERGLRQVTASLHDAVNVEHKKGFDQTGTPGTDFFAYDPAGALVVRLGNPAEIAASDSGAGMGDRGGSRAAAMAELAGAVGGADETYRKLVIRLGVEAQTANRRVDIQSNVLSQVDAAREAESGVSLDEEMTNMLAYQRGYEGAARFVTAIDQMLDTLINRTGLVGR